MSRGRWSSENRRDAEKGAGIVELGVGRERCSGTVLVLPGSLECGHLGQQGTGHWAGR